MRYLTSWHLRNIFRLFDLLHNINGIVENIIFSLLIFFFSSTLLFTLHFSFALPSFFVAWPAVRQIVTRRGWKILQIGCRNFRRRRFLTYPSFWNGRMLHKFRNISTLSCCTCWEVRRRCCCCFQFNFFRWDDLFCGTCKVKKKDHCGILSITWP